MSLLLALSASPAAPAYIPDLLHEAYHDDEFDSWWLFQRDEDVDVVVDFIQPDIQPDGTDDVDAPDLPAFQNLEDDAPPDTVFDADDADEGSVFEFFDQSIDELLPPLDPIADVETEPESDTVYLAEYVDEPAAPPVVEYLAEWLPDAEEPEQHFDVYLPDVVIDSGVVELVFSPLLLNTIGRMMM